MLSVELSCVSDTLTNSLVIFFASKATQSAATQAALSSSFRKICFRLEPLFVFIFMLCLLINLFFCLHSQDEHTTRAPKQLFQNNFASGPEHRLLATRNPLLPLQHCGNDR